MKAAVYGEYGPPSVLQIVDLPKPSPRANQVLVRVRATTVTSGDVRIRSFSVPHGQWLPARLALGLKGPRQPILGCDLAGVVEAVGQGVTRFAVGDEIYGQPPLMSFGAHAEYICMDEDWVMAPKPANMTFEEAAAVPFMGLSALYFVRQANIRAGQHVLVYGASGAVGTYAVQIAAHLGARVTGVCGTRNLEMVRSLGADQVIDYTQEDFRRNGQRYDVILDAVDKTSYAHCKGALRRGGTYVTVAGGLTQLVQMLWTSRFGEHRVIGGTASNDTDDLLYLTQLIEAGELRAVIDRTYPLERIAEAHEYVETGHKSGNVVITA